MDTATADILPECIIHKILSYISFKEAAKLTIVSKTWLKAWLAHPNLDFGLENRRDLKIWDQIMERYRDANIPIDKFKISENATPFSSRVSEHVTPLSSRVCEVYPKWLCVALQNLIPKWLGIALQNGVKGLVYSGSSLVYSCPFPIFTILAEHSIRELVLDHCNLMHHSLSTTSHVVVNCNSLRKLSLSYVQLNDEMLQTLLTGCSLIVELIIERCKGLTKIELRNLQKIKSASLSTNGKQHVTIQAPSLESLSCTGISRKQSPMLDIVECQNLKTLKISDDRMSDGFLEHLFSRSQFLERLTLDSVSKGLERINICRSQSLKYLEIEDCEGIGEIVAPNLVTLQYLGGQIPELKIAKERQLKHSWIILPCLDNLNEALLCKLRKFLSNPSSCSWVCLEIKACNELNKTVSQLHHRIAIPQVDNYPKVDNLHVEIQFSIDCPAFLDALLWCCRPRILGLHSDVETITCFIDLLMYMTNATRSTNQGSRPWHSQLKEVKAYRYDWTKMAWKREELRSAELARRGLREDGKADRIRFLLDW